MYNICILYQYCTKYVQYIPSVIVLGTSVVFSLSTCSQSHPAQPRVVPYLIIWQGLGVVFA